MSNAIQFGILLVLLVTLIAIWRSMVVQNRLFAAQLLWYRFDMYRWTYQAQTNADVEEFELFPEDYAEKSKYESYLKGNPTAIRRYIAMSKVYEYMAHTHALLGQKVPDPLGYHWIEQWAKDSAQHREFLDVHEYYKEYYPDFHAFVEALRDPPVAKPGTTQPA
jgi:hypothetical protein